jgi:hypothetical protein
LTIVHRQVLLTRPSLARARQERLENLACRAALACSTSNQIVTDGDRVRIVHQPTASACNTKLMQYQHRGMHNWLESPSALLRWRNRRESGQLRIKRIPTGE